MRYLFIVFLITISCYALNLQDGVSAYHEGKFDKALKIFKTLAKEKNDADAQYNIATMYMYAKGLTPDSKKAYFWFEKSAENGNENAQYMLGMMLENGIGTKKNLKKAFSWYKQSAHQNNAKGLYSLARFYDDGIVVSANKKMAQKLYIKAAKFGSVAAAYKVAQFLENEGKYKEAVQWYKALVKIHYIPAIDSLKKLCSGDQEYCRNTK